MYVMIQGGGDGVYANSGSCVAAAMYCEHERQELMEKGFKPEAFFHQYSDFVSTGEVIDRIDHNKKKLSNKDAKFYVITVNPSAEEQRKMGDTMDERIANFKNYIRYGVMDEYAKNFKRDLTANDIMYYAYVHVNRGNKEGEQMHAHIIVSRRDMDNAISLSPKTNHRGGKGVIAHGFDRDRFNNNCEIAFDNMMNYTRAFEESYEYLNAKKNGTFRDIANVTAKAAELEYGVDLSDWEKLVRGELDKVSVSETEAPKYEITAASSPATEPSVTETKTPVHQSSDVGIIGIAKKAWKSVTALFTRGNMDTMAVQPVQESKKNTTEVDVYKDNRGKFVLYMEKGGMYKSNNIVAEDALKYEQAKKSGNSEQFNKVCMYLESKYLKNVLEKKVEDKKHPVEQNKRLTVDMSYSKATNSYSITMAYGELYRCADNVVYEDAVKYAKAKDSGEAEQYDKVCRYLYDKYLKNAPDLKMTDKEQQQSIIKEQEPVQPERKKIADGLCLFPNKNGFSAAIFKDGKRCRFVSKIDEKDAKEFFKAMKKGDKDYIKKVSSDITAKYFHNGLARKVVKDFRLARRDENVTSVEFKNNPSTNNFSIKYEADGEWRYMHSISYYHSREINQLPSKEMEVFFNIVESMIFSGNVNVGAACGASSNKRRKNDDDDDKLKRKKGKGR